MPTRHRKRGVPCRAFYLIHVQGLYRGGLGCPPASPRAPVLPQSRRLISAPALQSAKRTAHDRNCGRPTVHNRRLKRILPQKPSLSRACLKTGEMSDLCPKTRAFKEKTARKACRLSRIFDAESTVLGQNRRRFGVFKQTLGLGRGIFGLPPHTCQRIKRKPDATFPARLIFSAWGRGTGLSPPACC